jgi:hypothetical protein
MARKQDNPDRSRKLDFENGRPTPVDDEDDAEDGGDS